jgi:glycerate kinase
LGTDISDLNILIAFDKFKGSIMSKEASRVVASILRNHNPSWKVRELPIADGGDGTLEILYENGYTLVNVEVFDAHLKPKICQLGLSFNEEVAFIEMASICGIAGLHSLDAFTASSFGLGVAAKAAISRGVKEVVIALGGSASTDGGLGFLMGLGAKAIDTQGSEISPNLNGLKVLASLDTDMLPSDISWVFLADVENPLVGKNGAAHIFGKQKGMAEKDFSIADGLLNSWADSLQLKSGKDIRHMPGTGAAGGIAAAGISILDARIESGSKWVAALLELEEAIKKADVVVTGEGSLDEQSFMGKGPGLVIELARKHQKEIYVIAGRVIPSLMQTQKIPFIALSELAPSIDQSVAQPAYWLGEAGKALAVILDA